MNHELTAGALFSGIGGFCYGFSKAGINTKWAVELDDAAAATYSLNFPNTRLLVKDIRNTSVKGDNLEPVDILHAGFPCQSFSQAGARQGFDDPRGMLFFEVIRIIKEFGKDKPSVLVLENAPYLKYGEGGAWFLRIEKEIKKAGYWFRNSNSAELDSYRLTKLPQRRNRLYMVAFSIEHFKNGRFNFPGDVNVAEKKLSRYIDFDGVKEEFYYLDEESRYHRMISEQVTDKNCLYQLRKYIVRVKEPDECPTLTANMGLGGHNVPFVHDSKGLRKLTEYECAALQGFPSDFVFPDSVIKSKRYTQIGNSVVPPVIEQLANRVAEKIIKERKL